MYKIYNAGGISATALARDIIFFSLAGPVGDDTGAHTVLIPILRGTNLRWAGRRSGDIL